MKAQFQTLQSLAIPIEKTTRRLFSECLGYELEKAECQLLDSLDFVISVERADSATERFLLKQQRSELATEIGLTINRLMARKLMAALTEELNLAFADVSLMESNSTARFSLLVLVDREHLSLSSKTRASA